MPCVCGLLGLPEFRRWAVSYMGVVEVDRRGFSASCVNCFSILQVGVGISRHNGLSILSST